MQLLPTLKKLVIGQPPNLRAVKYLPSTISEPEQWLIDSFTSQTKSGISVNSLDALRSTAVLSCVRILSEAIASLPLVVYETESNGGKRKATEHYLFNILHYNANPYMTTFEWRELLVQHLLLWGNHFAEIERNQNGLPIAIWPLRPDRMRIESNGMDLVYLYNLPEGREVPISGENILHVKGISGNGYVGQSLIGFAREAVGLGLAMEDFTARFFSNDATPRSYIKHPGRLSDKAKTNIEESLERKNRGLENKFRMQVLEEGMSIDTIGMPLEDAQFLELRKFEELDVYKIFRVPPHMGGILDRATFSNIEQQAIEFVVHSLQPWLIRSEQAFQRDLFFANELGKYYCRFVVAGLLRGDIASRYAAYATARQWGWINVDEIRELEDLNPLPDGNGQTYIVPMNFQPIDMPPQSGVRKHTNGNGHATDTTPFFETGGQNEI